MPFTLSQISDRFEEDREDLMATFETVFEDFLFQVTSRIDSQEMQEFPDIFKEDSFGVDSWLWAWATMWSRSFNSDRFDSLLFLPLLDMFNHKGTAKVCLPCHLNQGTCQVPRGIR